VARSISPQLGSKNHDRWQQLAYVGLVIRTLQAMVTSEDECQEARTEAEMLIPKLHAVTKRPPII
jgi:hypothetical protein